MSISTSSDYKAHSYGLSGAISSLGNNNGASFDLEEPTSNLSAAYSSSNGSYQGIMNSMATLSNIGNSCYLNSVVYTLRFAPNFMHNLHHLVDELNFLNQFNQQNSRNKSASLGRSHQLAFLNSHNNVQANGRSLSNKDLVSMGSTSQTNGLGSTISNGFNGIQDNLLKCNRQTATEKLHELYQHLTRNEQVQNTDPYQPVQLLNAVQDVSTTFEGNQQQDAHEFLMCVLDSIRETCQTLKKRFAESAELQKNINGPADGVVDQLEPSNLSTPIISTSGSNPSNNTSFMSLFNLKKKSKRREEKAAATLTGVTKQTTAKIPEIVIDYNSAPAAVAMSVNDGPFESKQVECGDRSVGGGGGKGVLGGTSDGEKLGSDFFSDDFEGVTVSTTKCLSCETETEQKETMIDIAIPISAEGNLESKENAQIFFQNSCITREYFRGDNKYRCEKCSAYTEAIRSISFEVLPRLLVIQLKRFNGGMEKINSFIPTPFVLQCFCRKCYSLPNEKKHHIYKLYSVITHVGATMSAGHYITYTCSLDCYCDYVNCVKESEKAKFDQQQNQAVVTRKKANSGVQLINGGSGSGGNNLGDSDYEIDGKYMMNLSNAANGNNNSNGGSNLIDKIKNNKLFNNKKLGRSKVRAASIKSATTNQQIEAMNSHNELIERHLNDASSQRNNTSPQTPQFCRGLNCCSIKAKSNFLVKSVNNLDKVSHSNGEGNFYCNNLKHQQKFGISSSSSCLDNGDGGMDSALTASTSSSSSSASNSSKFHQNGSYGKSRGTFIGQSDEPIWYMCDDDKIKSMPQHEFKELLSSNRKIAITPYLLFYARNDL